VSSKYPAALGGVVASRGGSLSNLATTTFERREHPPALEVLM